ncbi:hypothetical protein FMM68_09805 [Lachnospiraceae bacterium MD329]|nr:hypothetical protein [Lachnospiraceae bacterium MD329]
MSKKAVLLSIKPKFCELIASGKKTVEIRKNRPKIDVPFKVYIYCTKGDAPLVYGSPVPNYIEENLVTTSGYSRKEAERIFDVYNGKVIGEFVCDNINKFRVFSDSIISSMPFDIEAESCLTLNNINNYIGTGISGYAWHISDLVIYDKPKELSEFYKSCVDKYCYCEGCQYGYIKYPEWVETAENLEGISYDTYCLNLVQRPPQNWCYVEELI